ncbi:MAG: nucleotidyltransferase domain-containing protein [Proteobacteria bacterium]|nr:nucleotidyltransferase domain-containing protein [Pseudomonadota bacterium]
MRTGLADALFSGTQQRVLGLLFGQPERSFFASELIRLVGAGSGAVQRELGRLAESGLVVVSRIGNQKHYQANRDASVFKELHGLVVKTVGLVDPLRAALSALGERVHLALVYGSIAKKSETATSDIDVLIVADNLTLEEVYTALATAEEQLARRVNPTLYTPAEFIQRRRDGNPFLTKVLAGKFLPLIGKEADVSATAR